jgi:hypothetical protein
MQIAQQALQRGGLAETMEPKMLVMDEPVAALDVRTRTQMRGFLDVWRNPGPPCCSSPATSMKLWLSPTNPYVHTAARASLDYHSGRAGAAPQPILARGGGVAHAAKQCF